MDLFYILCVLLNFFYLSKDDDVCAKEHGDKHLHKMIVEHAQILSYVWHNLNPDHPITTQIYKASKSHGKHPVTLWAQKSIHHYRKIVSVTESLLKERKARGFDKEHKTGAILMILKNNEPPSIPHNVWSDPPKCMPTEYHTDQDGNEVDVITSYRWLYAGDKVEIAKLRWEPKARNPTWLDESKRYINSRPDILSGIAKRKRESDTKKDKQKEKRQKEKKRIKKQK